MKGFKVILGLSLFLTNNSFSQINPGDLKSLHLKGRVSNLIEIVNTCPSQVAEGTSTLNCKTDSTAYKFNKAGKVTSIIKTRERQDFYYDKSQRLILIEIFARGDTSRRAFHYSPDGDLIEKVITSSGNTEKVTVRTINKNDTLYVTEYKNTDGQPRKKSEEIFIKGRSKIRTTTFNAEGKPNLMWMYSYNSEGHMTKLERYEWWNNRKNCTIEVYQLNAFGDSEQTQYYDCNRLTDSDDFSINYKFDKRKNWISKSVYGSYTITLSRREYIYY